MKSALPVQQTGLPLVNYINTVNKTNLIFIYNDLVFIVYLSGDFFSLFRFNPFLLSTGPLDNHILSFSRLIFYKSNLVALISRSIHWCNVLDMLNQTILNITNTKT